MAYKLTGNDFVVTEYENKEGLPMFLMAKNVLGMFTLYKIEDGKAVKLESATNPKTLEEKYDVANTISK